MGASLRGGSSVSRSRKQSYRPMAEINVTPFVDVMLVLLIVFMVSAPMLTVGVPVNLPKADGQAVGQPQDPISITVAVDGRLFVDEEEVKLELIRQKLSDLTDEDLERKIFIRGDKDVAYGEVVKAMAEITNAGYTKIALVSEPIGTR